MPMSAARCQPACQPRPRLPCPRSGWPLLARVTDGLDAHGLWWLSGYAAGLASAHAPTTRASGRPAGRATPRRQPAPDHRLRQPDRQRQARWPSSSRARPKPPASPVRLLRADAYPPRELKNERLLYVVISTQGDGDPPDDARGFVEFIAGKRAPQLQAAAVRRARPGRFELPAVLRDRPRARRAPGRTRRARGCCRAATPTSTSSTVATPWLRAGAGHGQGGAEAGRAAGHGDAAAAAAARAAPWRATRPSPPSCWLNQRITGARRAARTCATSNCRWKARACTTSPAMRSACGRAIRRRWSTRCSPTLQLDGDAAVAHGGETLPLREWLAEQARTDPAGAAVPRQRTPRSARSDELNGLLAPGSMPSLRTPARRAPGHRPAARVAAPTGAREELVAALRPLTPRLYSIASSQKRVGEEAHLTVAHVDYDTADGARAGARPRTFSPRSAEGDAAAGLRRAQRALPPAGRRRRATSS